MPSTYSKKQLERLWIGAGGNPKVASTAAAIALAESSGNPRAQNPESPAAGLWQIDGPVVSGNLYNPQVNARNAVKKYNDAKGFSPWVTYTSGAYKSFVDVETPVGPNIPFPGPNVDPLAPFDAAPKAGLEALKSPGSVLGGIGEVAKFFTEASKLLFTPEGWLQIGQVSGGVILIGWGLHRLVNVSTGVNVAGQAKHAGLKAAELAAVVK